MQTKAFLNTLDHERIVKAIREAEACTRAEVRVHVSNQAVDDAPKAAADQFEKLGMTATAERNGVLIYVAPASTSPADSRSGRRWPRPWRPTSGPAASPTGS